LARYRNFSRQVFPELIKNNTGKASAQSLKSVNLLDQAGLFLFGEEKRNVS